MRRYRMRRRPDIATNRAGIDESRGLTFQLPLFRAPALIAPIRGSLARRCDQSSLRSASGMHLTMSRSRPDARACGWFGGCDAKQRRYDLARHD